MLAKTEHNVLDFNPSVFGLKDITVDDSPELEFQLITDDEQFFSHPTADIKRKVNGFNVYDEEGNFIGWLDVFIGGLGSLSYIECKPGDPTSVYAFNQPLFAGPRDSEHDLIDLAQKCTRHYHDYLQKSNSSIKWTILESELSERKFNQIQPQGVM